MTTKSEIKERPILFATQMVQATLSGDKTQTRRIIRPQPDDSGLHNHTLFPMSLNSDLEGWHGTVYENGKSRQWNSPYGKPGDRLWVKETFYAYGFWSTRWSDKKGREEWYFTDITEKKGMSYLYHADCTPNYHPIRVKNRVGYWKRPALFMPRTASRILLDINNLWPEKLQDISEEDAKEEGVSMCYETSEGSFVMPDKKTDFILGPTGSYYSGFKSIWHSINGSESWSENPFVWAVEFRRINP